MKKGSGQMKGVISFFFFSSLRVVYGRSREFFLPSTLYISPRVSKIAIEIPGIFFAEKNRGGGGERIWTRRGQAARRAITVIAAWADTPRRFSIPDASGG